MRSFALFPTKGDRTGSVIERSFTPQFLTGYGVLSSAMFIPFSEQKPSMALRYSLAFQKQGLVMFAICEMFQVEREKTRGYRENYSQMREYGMNFNLCCITALYGVQGWAGASDNVCRLNLRVCRLNLDPRLVHDQRRLLHDDCHPSRIAGHWVVRR